MNRLLRIFIIVVSACILLYSSYQIYIIVSERAASNSINADLVQNAVTVKQETESPKDNDPQDPQTSPDAEQTADTVPIEVNFKKLLETYDDVVGWIYSEDTPINLPIVQAEDNDYYLHRLIDGSINKAGTLFVDSRNAGDFSDSLTIVYGHNMKNDTMFGTLTEYSKQTYYRAHPVMWLFTPSRNYKIELVAGYVTSTTSDIFMLNLSKDQTKNLLAQAQTQSDFETSLELSEEDRYIVLSTCSYEFENARYVVIGRLIPME